MNLKKEKKDQVFDEDTWKNKDFEEKNYRKERTQMTRLIYYERFGLKELGDGGCRPRWSNLQQRSRCLVEQAEAAVQLQQIASARRWLEMVGFARLRRWLLAAVLPCHRLRLASPICVWRCCRCVCVSCEFSIVCVSGNRLAEILRHPLFNKIFLLLKYLSRKLLWWTY